MGQFVIKLLLKTYLQVAGTFFKQNDLSQWLSVSMSEWLTSRCFLSVRLRQAAQPPAAGLPVSVLTCDFQAYLTDSRPPPPAWGRGSLPGMGLGGGLVWGSPSRGGGRGLEGAGLLSELRTVLWT